MHMNGPLIILMLLMRQPGTNSTSTVYTISEVTYSRTNLIVGFGNVSYIGFLPINLYRSVDLEHKFIQQP